MREYGGCRICGGEGVDGLTLLGEGREAEVYALPDGAVLKLLRQPSQSAEREIAALTAVAGHDVPAPRVRGRTTIDGRPGILLDRVSGPDLLSLLETRPWLTRRAGLVLASVHARMHATVAPPTLPDLRTELGHRIRSAPALPDGLRSWTLSILDGLPDGDRLCHGDMHLGNILGGFDAPMVIDWTDAARGDATADVANTWLLHRMGQPPPGTPLYARAVIPLARGVVVSAYLRAYRRTRPFDLGTFRRWQIVRVAARLSAGIEQEVDALTGWLRARAGVARWSFTLRG
jgi:aminoglycoside phosphotransferase (APT) family kinase protein